MEKVYFEEIKNFEGTRYIDNNTFLEDMLDKKIMIEIFEDLVNSGEISPPNFLPLFHIINELDRNVRNHSGIFDKDKKYYKFCLDIEGGFFKISIHDDGNGISKIIPGSNEFEKISKSLQEGVTTGTNWIMAGEQNKNSGYGLFALFGSTRNPRFSGKIISNGTVVLFSGFESFVKPQKVESEYNMNVFFSGYINSLSKAIMMVQDEAKVKSVKSIIDVSASLEFYDYMSKLLSKKVEDKLKI